MNTAISITELHVMFDQHIALKEVTATFAAKQITALVGHSGSGKTTLLRSLNRLNEEYTNCITQGQVKINLGHGLMDIYTAKNEQDLSLLRQKIGMVFQTPQLLPVSIYKNISMPLQLIKGCSKKELMLKVEEALSTVGLWLEVKDRLDEPAYQLSGGQQQRLCLARTLALQPRILLLDEPTSSLDIDATQVIEDLLHRLREHYTIIMVSHSLEQACHLADQLIIMEKGKIKALFKNPISKTEVKAMLSSTLE